jgi:uncharacterized membrane protein YraQ (UPF0718 family)
MKFTEHLSQHKHEWKWASLLTLVFLVIWNLPVESLRFQAGIHEALALTHWYAREHVILCLLPAFFIAGSITAFLRQGAVMKYLGAGANRLAAYGVASVSGTILAVCSCTVLPLFAGIYRMGAGLGPATAFLYSGPAISALAMVMSAKVLGIEMGLARGIGAIVFSIMIGLIMAVLFRKDESQRNKVAMQIPEEQPTQPLWQTASFLATQVVILIFANWGPSDQPFFAAIFIWKWKIVAASALILAIMLDQWFNGSRFKIITVGIIVAIPSILLPAQPAIPFSLSLIGLVWVIAGTKHETGEWWRQTWSFTKQVMPLLLAGVFIAGLLLGRPDHEAWIPSDWVNSVLGGDGILPVFYASLAGSLMYFATLTEIPIVEGLQGAGMSQGAALALLLAGPALSLPNMLVIRSIIGSKKTFTYIGLVVLFSTLAGWLIGPLL